MHSSFGWISKLAMQIFDACKAISAADIARREGISLYHRGAREWACCPLHEEKTASLMFDDAGNWHCFGCGVGGDAVAFYAALHKLTAYESAKALAQTFGLVLGDGISHNYQPAPIAPAKQLMDKVEHWFQLEWNRACAIKHKAAMLMDEEDTKRDKTLAAGKFYSTPDVFYLWVAAKAEAECRLDTLQLTDVGEKIMMMLEERNEHTQAG